MLTLARERLPEVLEDVHPLLEDHYTELARHRDRVALKPGWERYARLEQANALRIFTAREEGTLVGYAAFICTPHLHYADLFLASNDVLFLHAAHRRGRTGLRLIGFCEDELTREFAGRPLAIAWHAKPNTSLEAILRKRADYGVQDIVFTRLHTPT